MTLSPRNRISVSVSVSVANQLLRARLQCSAKTPAANDYRLRSYCLGTAFEVLVEACAHRMPRKACTISVREAVRVSLLLLRGALHLVDRRQCSMHFGTANCVVAPQGRSCRWARGCCARTARQRSPPSLGGHVALVAHSYHRGQPRQSFSTHRPARARTCFFLFGLWLE